MKKLIALVFIVSLVMNLSSCFRDADDIPAVTQQMNESSTDIRETVTTEPVGTIESEIIYDPPKPTISEAAMKWIEQLENSSEIIMTPEEIAGENLRLIDEAESIVDILNVTPVYSAEDMSVLIDGDRKPASPFYDGDGAEITDEHYMSVIANMGSDSIAGDIVPKRGIVTSRANLRCIPDSKPYLKSPESLYDSLQQTELHFASPLWVLSESLDREYYYVQAYNYRGWVKSSDVAITEDKELWLEFADPASFICITDTSVKVLEKEIDMGVRLPLIGYDGEKFKVKLPARSTDGMLELTEAEVDHLSANVGYLPYTYENFYSQAFKYEGVMYSWGGLDTGVDCSGFISNVMRTFGFMLPRDTKDQESIVGTAVDVRGKSHGEIAVILDGVTSPTAVYTPGHVLFYLGKNENGNYMFIHAPKIGESVCVTKKTSLAGISYVCEFKKR